MASQSYILAIDQGTSSSRAVLFDERGMEVRSASREVVSHFPYGGWVEQDARAIWEGVLACAREAAQGVEKQVRSIGITNQRETIVCWDPSTGEPLAPAIVWQCRRSAEICERLRRAGHEPQLRSKTGLVLDPYFSASKILWLLENNAQVSAAVKAKRAVFGTIDSWILFKLTSTSLPVIATEPSNASRTMLFSLESGAWEPELLSLFGISVANLPEIRPSWGEFGTTTVLGSNVPIAGILGDQQASLFGQGCIEPRTAKCTFGTGAFLLMHCGPARVSPDIGILETVAWRDGTRLSYALEGSVFVAGAVVRWLREALGILHDSAACEERAARVSDSGGVMFVPAFVGLGAPYWDSSARAAIMGLSLGTTGDQIIRAALEGVAHQVGDLTAQACFSGLAELKIDGGMSVNQLFCQMLSDIASVSVTPSIYKEMTAFGVARAAALGAGVFTNLDDAVREFCGPSKPQDSQTFVSKGDKLERKMARERWIKAVEAARSL